MPAALEPFSCLLSPAWAASHGGCGLSHSLPTGPGAKQHQQLSGELTWSSVKVFLAKGINGSGGFSGGLAGLGQGLDGSSPEY